MNTERLIETLARGLTPAAPLSKPWIRSAWWLLGTAVYFSVLTLMMASPAEVVANGRAWPSAFDNVVAIVTAVIAANAAFGATVPGFLRRLSVWPALAAMVWVGSVAGGAIQEWNRGGVSLAVPSEWGCVAMIALGSVLPGVGMVIMLRRGAPLRPALTAVMAVLATGMTASVSACLSHPHASDAVTLVWHGTTIVVLVVTAARFGRGLLTWRTRF